MKFKEGMKKSEKLSVLQRMIMVHSYIYYERGQNLISDMKYDKLCKLVVKLKDKYPKSWKLTQYYYVFYDFDGNTGFDLFDRLNKRDKARLKAVSKLVYRAYYKKEKMEV